MGSRLSENDGFNETLLPVDYKFAGNIVDDDINKIMVNPLPEGVTLHCLIGACHSGTVMDLPFLAGGKNEDGQYAWEDQSRKQFKGTAGGMVLGFEQDFALEECLWIPLLLAFSSFNSVRQNSWLVLEECY
jgi:hypothetical protein